MPSLLVLLLAIVLAAPIDAVERRPAFDTEPAGSHDLLRRAHTDAAILDALYAKELPPGIIETIAHAIADRPSGPAAGAPGHSGGATRDGVVPHRNREQELGT